MKHYFKNYILVILLTIFSISSKELYGACEANIFNIKANPGIKIFEIIGQLAEECDLTLIIKDDEASQKLQKKLNRLSLKDVTLKEALDVILNENNLNYSLDKNILKISYLLTKTFHVDYIGTERQSNSNTKVSLTSGSTAKQSMSSAESESGMEITSDDKFIFWSEFADQIKNILNRPEDDYEAADPVIDRESGLITITGTKKQLDRVDKYIKLVMNRLHKQVLIDVKMFSVVLSKENKTGINWKEFYNFNSDITFTNSDIVTTFVMKTKLGTIIKFLETQGDVHSISNPKILTLNNQAAMITVGKQYFYKIVNSTTTSNTGGSTTSTNEVIDSVFAGILLDITPEISDDNKITLKINPSVSDTISTLIENSDSRTMPPDLERRQISTVVTVKDGEHIILGGLITEKNSISKNKIPLLGDIPLLGYAFNYKEKTKEMIELVIIVTPHIVKNSKLIDANSLGYNKISKMKPIDVIVNKTEK